MSDAATIECARLRSENEELRSALKPFAKEADEWAASVPDEFRSLCTEPGSDQALEGSETSFTVGDLRNAKRLMEGHAPAP